MDRNMTLLIDPETMDLVFDDAGIMRTISGDITTAQCVRLTLLAEKESFPLDTTHGIRLNRILGRKNSDLHEDETNEVLREAIFQEQDIASIESMAAEVDGRILHAQFSGTLYSGRTISMEVNV